jgi:tetratricopeptide (TPR) repeat protein
MTENRYFRLQDLVFDSYFLDAPVDIEKGALLLDLQTKSVILQLRLNILQKPADKISSVNLEIECFDDGGEKIKEYSPYFYSFRDINFLHATSFGENIPIILDPLVRKVKVQIEKVTFLDTSVWKPSRKSITPPKQKNVSNLESELLGQLNLDKKNLPEKSQERIVFIPKQEENYWLCACGRPNSNEIIECCRCGISKNWLFENATESSIRVNFDNRIEKERHLKEAQEAKKAKQKKRTLITALIVGLFIIGVALVITLPPYLKYSEAANQYWSKNYDQAITSFESLGDYKNSQLMLNDSKYLKAKSLLEAEKYDAAIELFKSISPYNDSADLILKAKYEKAKDLLAQKKFDEAISIFTDLGNYVASSNLIVEANYQKAKYLFENKKYLDSIDLYLQLKAYKDSPTLLTEAYYQEALRLIDEKKDVSSAISFLKRVGDYKDSYLVISKLDFSLGKEAFENQKWEEAVNLLSMVNVKFFPEVSEILKTARANFTKQKYDTAKVLAQNQDYKGAYNLLHDLNYKDSAYLTKIYGRKAFPWTVTGGMTKNSYSKYDNYSVDYTLHGGIPGDKITIFVICTTPDWTSTAIDRGMSGGSSSGWYWSNDSPAYASRGKGTITIKVAETGEILARYTFTIY